MKTIKSPSADIMVIGGGAGGVAAALRARQLGARVILVEKENLGGLCMNRGCIPTKTLLQTALLVRKLRRAYEFGIRIEGMEVDLEALMAKKDDLVGYLRMGTEALLRRNGVKIVKGRASFLSPTSVDVDGKEFPVKSIILATGSTWSSPPVKGIQDERVISTDQALSLKDIPKSILILGGGPVELELAQYFLLMGSRVTLMVEGRRVLPHQDRDLGIRISSLLRDEGMEIITRAEILSIEGEDERLLVRYLSREKEGTIHVERILHARRRPSVEDLKLERAGLRPQGGVVSVDATLRTQVPTIWAVGDVTGEPMLSHRASAMGMVAAENALGRSSIFRPEYVPRCACTVPEVASVGLTEREAREKFKKINVGTIPYSINSRAMIIQETEGMVKVISELTHRKLLGVHIIGPHASELISEGTLALQLEATVEDLTRGIRFHPSLSESFVEAARECLEGGIYVLK